MAWTMFSINPRPSTSSKVQTSLSRSLKSGYKSRGITALLNGLPQSKGSQIDQSYLCTNQKDLRRSFGWKRKCATN
ncbi:hypothetical protein L484_014668 [Morus notabilis]|uniref:Uncharacterized protein n=1 Tax=Morus notabilis TaxID=981085 RepID=W9RUW9_9ROSA|nr:hypothetical protein L484_014668 [Morus notabilis]